MIPGVAVYLDDEDEDETAWETVAHFPLATDPPLG